MVRPGGAEQAGAMGGGHDERFIQAMSGTDVQGTLREMWETRPARPREDRQVAGVAAGIARRYDLDPVLVRIGFVVAAFSGIGAALYIAGWILLPEAPADPEHPGRPRSPRVILLVALAVAAVVSIGSVFGRGGIVLPALAVATLLFRLHRSRSDRGPGGAPAPAAAAATSAVTPAVPSLRTEPADPAPPAWDPLGAAPFAWDLPEPAPAPAAPPVPPRRRLPVTAVTLAVALIAGGLTAVVLLVADALSLTNLPLLLGVVLAVIGCGLVAGSFLRAGRGLISIALVLSALTWAVVVAPLDRWQAYGISELRAAPATVAAVRSSYQRSAGDIELDLRRLDLAVPAGGDASPVRSRIALGAGDVQVWLPDDADLRLTASVGVGRVAYGDREEAGPGSRLEVLDDLGTDGVRSDRQLVVDIETGVGTVEVRRG
jgi:phage shock protein PspC (stress-responsive transcriptional regulator)